MEFFIVIITVSIDISIFEDDLDWCYSDVKFQKPEMTYGMIMSAEHGSLQSRNLILPICHHCLFMYSIALMLFVQSLLVFDLSPFMVSKTAHFLS